MEEMIENEVKDVEFVIDVAFDGVVGGNNEGGEVIEVDSSAQDENGTNGEGKFGAKIPHKGPREMYDGKDGTAKKLKMTQVQYDWVQSYLKSGNATQAIREVTEHDGPEARQLGFNMKHNTRIMKYIQERALSCAEIQYEEIIRNPKAPYSVRNDAIKSVLDRAGVGVRPEEDKGNTFVGQMTITVEK